MPSPGVLRRAGLQILLWSGPLSIAVAFLLLVASLPFFHHGPGVPPAGDSRAWSALWGAFGIVALGSVTGLVANVAWVAVTARRRRPGGREWLRAAVNVLLGAGLLVWWFAS